jgi:hypothetical protein
VTPDHAHGGDLLVLDAHCGPSTPPCRSLLRAPADQIGAARVDLTFLAGRIVFDRLADLTHPAAGA